MSGSGDLALQILKKLQSTDPPLPRQKNFSNTFIQDILFLHETAESCTKEGESPVIFMAFSFEIISNDYESRVAWGT